MLVSGLQKMARLKTPLALALLSLAVPLGCASRPLVPSESVRLGQNEGILVIHTDSPLQFKLRAEGFDGVWKQDSGDQISLVVVPARECMSSHPWWAELQRRIGETRRRQGAYCACDEEPNCRRQHSQREAVQPTPTELLP